jgi:predicted ATPase
MLKSWFVENFKSAKDRVELPLAPLTIFAGANSSGKSTILQSILLAKQTFQYSHVDRPLALNGPILKLGRFDDVRHVNAIDNYIGLGGTFDTQYEPLVADGPLEPSLHRYFAEQAGQEFTSVSFEARLDVSGDDDASQTQPNLVYGAVSGIHNIRTLEVDIEDTEPSEIENDLPVQSFLAIRPISESTRITYKSDLKESSTGIARSFRFEHAAIDPATRDDVLDDRPSATIIGAGALHFLPSSLAVQYDANALRAARIAEALCSLSSHYRGRSRDIENQRVDREVVELMADHLRRAGNVVSEQTSIFGDNKAETLTVAEAVSQIQHSIQGQDTKLIARRASALARMQAYRVALQEIQPQLAQKIASKLGVKLEIDHTFGDDVSNITGYLQHFFEQGISYIGPLRDEPKPLYPLEALSAPFDVGYRGEHTAAVLELNRDRAIRYISPAALEGGNVPTSIHTASLHDAVVEWLSYLGVAEDISTSDLGKFGHSMQVMADGVTKSHDLTNVGVGVSQVLPIIVMSLLATQRSLLIFEQPELHLHPKVQSRLGDFFLSLTMQGKQCVVETHSEYLVQRIRRRIAESEGDVILGQAKIYFVERMDGQSNYQEVNISEYGSIVDWPRDFFDQGDREIEKIIEASSRKQAREKSRGKV